jgi:hypothetical protein
MMETEFILYFAPILVFLIAFIIGFIALTMLKVPGTPGTHAILSALIAFVFIISTQSIDYLITAIPWLTVLTVVTLIVLIPLALLGGGFESGLKWIVFISAIVIVIIALFETFPFLSNMLPGSANSNLTSNLRHFKDFIYSENFKNSALFIVIALIVGFFITKK